MLIQCLLWPKQTERCNCNWDAFHYLLQYVVKIHLLEVLKHCPPLLTECEALGKKSHT